MRDDLWQYPGIYERCSSCGMSRVRYMTRHKVPSPVVRGRDQQEPVKFWGVLVDRSEAEAILETELSGNISDASTWFNFGFARIGWSRGNSVQRYLLAEIEDLKRYGFQKRFRDKLLCPICLMDMGEECECPKCGRTLLDVAEELCAA